MSKCAVLGCNTTKGMPGRGLHRFPMLTNLKGKTLAKARARQQAWHGALTTGPQSNRPKFYSYYYDKTRVCDLHFISGKPAQSNDVNNPDWVPTLNLDCKEHSEETNVVVKEEIIELNATDPIDTIDPIDATDPSEVANAADPSVVAKPNQVFILMDNPQSRIDFSKMCRLCLSENVLLINLYPDPGDKGKPSSNKILDIIERFTTIKISPTDKLPQKICQNCVQTLNTMLAFQNKCKRSDTELQKMKVSLEAGNDDQPNIKVEILDDDLMILDMEQVQVIDKFKSESDDENTFRYETRDDLEDFNITDESSRSSTDTTPKAKEIGRDFGSSNITKEPPRRVKERKRDFGSANTTNKPVKGIEIRYDLASFNMTNEPAKRTTQQKVACYMCGKLYESYHLQFHMNAHIGVRPYQCDVPNCDAKFAAPDRLRRHKQLCHSINPKLFKCDVCGRGFKIKGALKIHRTYHFDPNIPCTVCGKLIRNPIALKKHMLVHSQERKFKCEVCKKAFQNRYTLRIHKRVHTQEKPYSCFCGVSFAYKCLLKSHSEKYHKETNGKTDQLPPSIESSS